MISSTREELNSRDELAALIDELEGDLEVQSLLPVDKRLPAASIKALEDSLVKAREDLSTLGATSAPAEEA